MRKPIFIIISTLLFCASMLTVTVAYATSFPTAYVSMNGTGDFNWDGNGTSAQTVINQALEYVENHAAYTTVYLKGPATYIIDEPIIMRSNMILTGDDTAKVKLADNVAEISDTWNQAHGNKPMITQKGAQFWEGGDNYTGQWYGAIYGDDSSSIENAEISGFELEIGQQDGYSHGQYWYAGMYFFVTRNLSIHNMKMSNSYTDMIRIFSNTETNENIHIYDIDIDTTGHEGIYITRGMDLEIYDSTILHTRTNSGIRLSDCSQVLVHGNTIANSINKVPSGYAGIQIRSQNVPIQFLEIYDNYIYGKAGGIVLKVKGINDLNDTLQNIRIHHNILYNIFDNTAGAADHLNGGIHIHGYPNVVIENNVIDGSYKDGIVYEEYPDSVGRNYQTLVRNNIIRNCVGFGINNLTDDSEKHRFIMAYNDLYHNGLGNYHTTTSSTTDRSVDPLYANAPDSYDNPIAPEEVDFHLKSQHGRWDGSQWVLDAVTSQAIDTGVPGIAYALEPEPNGGRINMGAYGNTEYTSKSGNTESSTTSRSFLLQIIPAIISTNQ